MHNKVFNIDKVVHVHDNPMGKLVDEFLELVQRGLTNNEMIQNTQNYRKREDKMEHTQHNTIGVSRDQTNTMDISQ